jgi:hypothetical protein
MSLLSVLKNIGMNLGHVGGWIDDGLKLAAPIVGIVDPPLVPIITGIEAFLDGLPNGAVTDGGGLQAIVTAVTALQSIKSAAVAPTPGETPANTQAAPPAAPSGLAYSSLESTVAMPKGGKINS